MTHWALPLIGKPWALGATGPHAFDCWGLVRHVQHTRRGLDMPALTVGVSAPENAETIQEIARHSGWHRQPDTAPMEEYDVVLMRSRVGPHVAVVILVDGNVRLLHATGGVENPGRVVHSSVGEVRAAGWFRLQTWRHTNEDEK